MNNNTTDPVTGTRTISFWVNDGADDSNTAVAEINVIGVNSPPVVTAGETQNYTEGDGAVDVDTSITIADPDNTSMASAKVSITAGFVSGEDVLVYDGTDFGGPYTATNGVLTLTGTDSIANYKAALESVTYENTDGVSPTTGTRTITFVVNDGTDDSATDAAAATAQVNVSSLNTAPVVTAGGSAAFTEGDPAVVIDGAVSVSDVDDTELVGATVWIDAADYTSGDDVLSFTSVGSISGSFFPASGQLVLNGTDTVANYEAALQSVTYDNLNELNPVTGQRVIWYRVNDGDLNSATVSSEITVSGDNDAPILTAGATLNYTESDGAFEEVDAGAVLDITDPDSTNMSAATVEFSDGFASGEDFLNATAPGGSSISIAYDTDTGVLTLTGSDNVANYIDTLRTLTYANDSEDPSTAQRVLQITVADDGATAATSNTAAHVINIVAVNDVPVVAAGDSINYTEGDGTVVIDNTISFTDPDDDELVSARITITGNYAFGEDVLGYVSTASIGASWDDGLGVLTLQGTDTLTNYQAALENVTYENISDSPTENVRTIEFIVNDGEDDSTGGTGATAKVNVTAVNDPPVVTAGGVSYYTEGDGAVVVNNAIEVFDAEGDQIIAASVEFGANFQSDDGFGLGDRLDAGGNWDFNTNTGVLTLTTTQDFSTVQDDLQSMTYENNSESPTEGKRTLRITLNDGEDDSIVKKEVIWVVGVNDAPVVTADDFRPYNEGDPTTVIDNTITITDDGTGLVSARVSIESSSYVPGEDQLAYNPVGGVNVNGAWNSSTGVLTLTGTESLANYESALENVTYENIAGQNASSGIRPIEFIVNDGELDSQTGFEAVVVVSAADDPPVITSGNTAVFTEGGAAVVVDSELSLTDPDTANFTGATVEITGSPVDEEDRLAFDDGAFANISGTYNSNTNILKLVGSDTVANYEAALRTVTYDNVNDLNPDNTNRTISFVVDDDGTGPNPAVTATSVVQINDLNDPPVLTGGGTEDWIEGDGTEILDSGITQATDPENDAITMAKVNITTATYQPGEDQLVYGAGGSFGSTWNSTTGVLTITGSDDATTWAGDIAANVAYSNSGGENPTSGVRAVKFTIYDGELWSNVTTVEVNVVAENDPPVISSGDIQDYTEGDGTVFVDAGIGVTDVDSMLVAATVAFDPTNEYVPGEDVLAYSGTLVSAWDSVNGVLTLTGSDTPANYQAALRSVTYENLDAVSPTTGLRQIEFTVNDGEYDSTDSTVETAQVNVIDVNSPPEVTSGASVSWTEGDPAIILDPAIQVSDVDDLYLAEPGAPPATSPVAATVGFDSGFIPGEDELSFVDTAKITGVWSGTVLKLYGTDTVSNYQAALASVTYVNNGDTDPNDVTDGVRVVRFTVADDDAAIGDATMTLTVMGINDAPVLEAGFTQDYSDDQGTVTVDGGVLITDLDDDNMNSARVTITGGYVPGEDYLDVATSADYIKSFDTSTGTLSIIGTDTTDSYETTLQSVTYENMGGLNPTEGLRTIEFVVNDGDDDSTGLSTTATIDVSDVNDAPIITTVAGTVDWTEGDAPVALDANLEVTDPDSDMLSGATLVFDAAYTPTSGDTLSFTGAGSINGTWNSVAGKLRLQGSDTVANYEAALRSVTYENITESPAQGTRGIMVWVADEEGMVATAVTTVVDVMDVNDPPILTATGTVDYVEEAGTGSSHTMLLDPALDLTDPDDQTMNGTATVTFASGFQTTGEDRLIVTNALGLTPTYSTTTGILTLTGSTDIANWEAALQSVAYGNWVDTATDYGDNPTSGQRLVTFTVNDGQDDNTGLLDTVAINVIPTNDPAEVSTVTGTTAYTEDAGAVVIDATAAITDVDDLYLESAVVAIDNFEPGEDVLNFTDASGITGSWDGMTGTLTLSGHSLVKYYESALQSVTYDNLSDDPTAGTRGLSITVNDGDIDSAAVTRGVLVNAVNDAPVVTSGATLEWTEGDGTQVIDATMQIDDVDSATLAGATVTFTAATIAGDVLDAPGFAYAAGDLTWTGAETVANIELALQQMTYENTTANPGSAQRVILITVNDGFSDSEDATSVINVTPVNDAPVVTSGNTIDYTEGVNDRRRGGCNRRGTDPQ